MTIGDKYIKIYMKDGFDQNNIARAAVSAYQILEGKKGSLYMENNIIILEDENGVEIEFETIDVYEFEGHTFFALVEVVPEEEESDEVLIMMVDGDIESEDAELVMVEDEDLLKRAFDEFIRRDEEAANAEQ